MLMPGRQSNPSKYRFGLNGMEKDNEVKGTGNSYTTYFRSYDPRVGRWLSIDPVTHSWQTPYGAFNNNPTYFTDPTGAKGDPPSGIGKFFRNLRTKIFGRRRVSFDEGKANWGEQDLANTEFTLKSVEISVERKSYKIGYGMTYIMRDLEKWGVMDFLRFLETDLKGTTNKDWTMMDGDRSLNPAGGIRYTGEGGYGHAIHSTHEKELREEPIDEMLAGIANIQGKGGKAPSKTGTLNVFGKRRTYKDTGTKTYVGKNGKLAKDGNGKAIVSKQKTNNEILDDNKIGNKENRAIAKYAAGIIDHKDKIIKGVEEHVGAAHNDTTVHTGPGVYFKESPDRMQVIHHSFRVVTNSTGDTVKVLPPATN